MPFYVPDSFDNVPPLPYPTPVPVLVDDPDLPRSLLQRWRIWANTEAADPERVGVPHWSDIPVVADLGEPVNKMSPTQVDVTCWLVTHPGDPAGADRLEEIAARPARLDGDVQRIEAFIDLAEHWRQHLAPARNEVRWIQVLNWLPSVERVLPLDFNELHRPIDVQRIVDEARREEADMLEAEVIDGRWVTDGTITIDSWFHDPDGRSSTG